MYFLMLFHEGCLLRSHESHNATLVLAEEGYLWGDVVNWTPCLAQGIVWPFPCLQNTSFCLMLWPQEAVR